MKCGKDDLDSIRQTVEMSMRIRYRVSLDDLEITEVPGYWRDRVPKMHPGHPLHSCLFCDGPFRATYTYSDSNRVGGRFASPTRSWAALKRAECQEESCC